MSDIHIESPSVQSYVGILQGVMGRMASHSAACKTWCIALVSAVIVIVADKTGPDYVWISVVPIGLFFLLDSYYLGLERSFRIVYNAFIAKLHDGTARIDDVFVVTPVSGTWKTLRTAAGAACSVSVWPFYLILGGMLIAIRIWIL